MDSTLGEQIGASALAFRGYNITNLGRTAELLAVPAYERVVREELARFSGIAADVLSRSVDLEKWVADRREPELAEYGDAIALVVAVESTHLRLLAEVHGVDVNGSRMAFGYSLGEVHAICTGGVFRIEDLIRVPLALADDCAAMAADATMAIVFSRGRTIAEEAVSVACARATASGPGSIGVSAILSPNTYLVVGQDSAVDRFREIAKTLLPGPIQIRLNGNRWPPLHTPLVRQRCIVDRAATMLEKLELGPFPPRPDVVSLATGRRNLAEHNTREILRTWVDHPQRLWDAVCEVLAADVRTVLHVGPAPNVIPATFARIAENVRQQADGNMLEQYGFRAMTSLARRPWLAAMLPARAALLRAPHVRQVVVEDWLLEHAPR